MSEIVSLKKAVPYQTLHPAKLELIWGPVVEGRMKKRTDTVLLALLIRCL